MTQADTESVATTEGKGIDVQSADQVPEGSAEQVTFQVIYGKVKQDVTWPLDSTVLELKKQIETSTRIEPSGQKLLNKGVPLKDDTATLRKAGVKQGAKLMLIGTPAAEVAATQAVVADSAAGEWDAPVSNEPICKQTAHAKVLAKGKPEDAMPGLAGRQIPMPDEMTAITGMTTSHGTKVRLTFKEDMQQLWLATAERTQKVSYGSITKIETWPIDDHPEYSIVALNLSGGKYWLYWYPSQYTSGLKIRVIGVQALI